MTSMKDVRIKRAESGLGLGLYARRPFAKAEHVAEYSGKRIPTKLADTLTTRYLFELDEYWTIDGSPRTNIARYINHSCVPNCETDVIDGKIIVYALRAIAEGEEFTFDYGEEYFDEFIRPFGCRCAQCKSKASIQNTIVGQYLRNPPGSK